MDEPRILYVTTKNREEALALGKILVKSRLCACVNILDGMESVYQWKGETHIDSECVLLVKTTSELVDTTTSAIKEHHTYDVPCVISLPLSATEGNNEYLQWIKNSVTNPNQ